MTWLGSLLEDVFVIDAPTLEPRYTYGGDVYSLDIVTGASIMPLIDDTGRIPDPPDPGWTYLRLYSVLLGVLNLISICLIVWSLPSKHGQ